MATDFCPIHQMHKVSHCCEARYREEEGRCHKCKEHCEAVCIECENEAGRV